MALPQNIEKVKNTPTAFVIFGATGDLARKKIFPSFFELFRAGLLPADFKIIAAARSKLEKDEFAKSLEEKISNIDMSDWQKFASKIDYVSCDVEKNLNLEKITQNLKAYETKVEKCVQRVFYMSISPFIYGESFENLGHHKMHLGCRVHGNPAKIVVEKPFGYDLRSAKKLNSTLEKYFAEHQIFRIDHYLGKETVQNIFAFRFGNEIFEPIWSNQYVDHVQITLAEPEGIEKRGEYYDRAGALRDIVQNHILQLVAIVTMDAPAKFEQKTIRNKKLATVKNIRKVSASQVATDTVRGQYQGYLQEEKVAPNSKTETFVALKLYVDTPRWQDVPFYVRCGKKMTGKVSSIIFQFKEKGHKIFENFWDKPMPNHIILQIQPQEGIGIRLVAKTPGLSTSLEPVDMEFCYKSSFDAPQPDAYERLLIDIIVGDQTLFLGQVEESWKFIDPIEKVWASDKPKLQTYKQGSWGPKAADDLIEKDNRKWLTPLLTICKI